MTAAPQADGIFYHVTVTGLEVCTGKEGVTMIGALSKVFPPPGGYGPSIGDSRKTSRSESGPLDLSGAEKLLELVRDMKRQERERMDILTRDNPRTKGFIYEETIVAEIFIGTGDKFEPDAKQPGKLLPLGAFHLKDADISAASIRAAIAGYATAEAHRAAHAAVTVGEEGVTAMKPLKLKKNG